jgi:hypothetical protein
MAETFGDKQTISLVRIYGGAVINDACAQLQGEADSDQQPVMGLFNGRILLAEPGGSARNLLVGFFDVPIGQIVQSSRTYTRGDGVAKVSGE